MARSGLIATEACRLAANADEFLQRARAETGLDITIVSRETEAKLAVSGCASLIDFGCDFALVFDIGGGSSELIWLDLTRRKHAWRHSVSERLEAQSCITAWTSLPVGVVTLAERFGGKFVNREMFPAMVEHVVEHAAAVRGRARIARASCGGRTHLLGTSGTVTTVAGVHLGLPRYERNRVDGCWLDIDRGAHASPAACSTPATRSAWRSPASARSAPISCLPDAPSWRPCCRCGRASACVWPTADCAKGILATLMTEDGVYRTSAAPAIGGGDSSKHDSNKRSGGGGRRQLKVRLKTARAALSVLTALAGAAAQRSLCGRGQGEGFSSRAAYKLIESMTGTACSSRTSA